MELEEDLYRIGTVASLTGVAVERLRAWDRRYGLAPAHRVGKTRFYNRAQLDRLMRIKQLIDQGQPISSLVDLSDEQLARRISATQQITAFSPRIGLIGPNLLVLEHQSDTTVQVAARWANMNAFASCPNEPVGLDVVVVQLPVLGFQHIDNIEKIYPEVRIVALYQFATEKHLNRVLERGIMALEWPLGWPEIERACQSGIDLPLRTARTAPRRFTDEQLIAIAANANDPSRSVEHLVDLISRLNAFAEYSLAWQDADEAPAGTAALHERLHGDVTQGRLQLEYALEALAEAEELIPGRSTTNPYKT